MRDTDIQWHPAFSLKSYGAMEKQKIILIN